MTQKQAVVALKHAADSLYNGKTEEGIPYHRWNLTPVLAESIRLLDGLRESIGDDLTLAKLRDFTPKRGTFYAKFPRMVLDPDNIPRNDCLADYKRRWSGFVRICKMLTREEGHIAVKLLDDGSLEVAA